MKSNVIFRMVAYTDAAGKYDPNAPRNGNEDNFFFSYNLSKDGPAKGEADVDTHMSDCGLLMVIADGMGGMNAGEVASQIAIDTVSEYFAPGKITPELAASHQKRKDYLEEVICEADIRIKKDSKHNDEHAGMGSTIILAWIVGNELTLSWCGDSRAYRYNPDNGIELLSKDHSYVQELVDKGFIRYEDTFEHPQGNIITRSLGDISKKAVPDTRFFQLYDNDIILLCSDGLSGVLRDKKTYDSDGELIECDNLEDIISANRNSLKKCREALWDAAEKADWYDNVTAIMCEIRSGTGQNYSEVKTNEDIIDISYKRFHFRIPAKKILLSVIGLLLFSFIVLLITRRPIIQKPNTSTDSLQTDTIVEKKAISLLAKIPEDTIVRMDSLQTKDAKDYTSEKGDESKEQIEQKNENNVNDKATTKLPKDSTKTKSNSSSTDKNDISELKETEDVKFTIQETDNYNSFIYSIKSQNGGFKIIKIVTKENNQDIEIDSTNFDKFKGKEVTVILQKNKQ